MVILAAVLCLCAASRPAAGQEEFDIYGGYMGVTSETHRSYTGTSTALAAHKLTDTNATFPENGLVGKYIHPNAKQEFIKDAAGNLKTLRFPIVRNTRTEIFIDPKSGELTRHAKASAPYKTSGFFTVEKLGKRWWFITPEGHGFIVLSVSVIARSPRDGEDRSGKGYRHYVPIKYKRKGDQGAEWIDRWGRGTLARLRSWGFNTIGTFSHGVQKLKLMAYNQTLRLSNYAVIKDGPCGDVWDGVTGGPFPDIYNPKFLPFIDARMKGAAKAKDDPWVLALFPDQMDELRGFRGAHNHLGWAALFGRREIRAGDKRANRKVKNHFKAEFIKMLNARYADKVEDLNKAWGTQLAGFDDLWDLKPAASFGTAREPSVKDHPKFREDLDAFEEKVGEDYTRAIRTTVRRYDPNHILYSVNMGGKSKPTLVRGFAKGGGYDVYLGWGEAEYEVLKRPVVGAASGYLTAEPDSPLHFEGDIEKCELVDLGRYKQVIKCWDYDADIWWKQRGNVLRLRFPGVPVPRKSITSPWSFQGLATGKDADGKSWFAARSGGGYRAGHPKELVIEINKMLQAGKKPRYERIGFGGRLRTQENRARKWAEGMKVLVEGKTKSGDYFRLGRNWWKLSDNGWTYWLERYNFGLVTLKDNAYDGKEATRLGADGVAGTWDDEAEDYGDLLTGMTKANKGIYRRILEHDAK